MKSVIGHRAERSHDGSSALTLACALLATLACAKGALDLAPFPCADDNGCPAGTLCLPGSAADAGSSCVAPQVNALCATTADCAGVSATAVCDQGRCRAACNSGAGCAGSDLCSSSSGPGVCLTACTSGATCPAGLSCGLLAPGSATVCQVPGSSPGSDCTTPGAVCGPLGANITCSAAHKCQKACQAGAGCAAGFVCSDGVGSGYCLKGCDAGVTCDAGTSCASLWYGNKKACLASGQGLETACLVDSARCGPEGTSSVCAGGSCLARCKGGVSTNCPTGQSCSATPDGVCLADCVTASPACQAGFTCSGPFADGKPHCVPPPLALGAVCLQEGLGCGPAGLGAICREGFCSLPCSNGTGCASGSFCTAATGPGRCLVDCTSNAASCGGGLTCQDWFDGVHKACNPSGAGVGQSCATEGAQCGPAGANTKCTGGRCLVACADGSTNGCPSGSACSAATGPGLCLHDCSAPNKTCPGDLVCSGPGPDGRLRCTPPSKTIGAACTDVSGTSCGVAGQGAKCLGGFCSLPCSSATPCATGSFCTSATASPGVCVSDCTAGGQTICAANLTCGAYIDASGKKACTPPSVALEAACAADDTPCGPLGATGTCAGGACVPPCAAGTNACGSGRVCTRTVASGLPSGCVTDCASSASACSAPLGCKDLWHDGAQGCLARPLAACTSVTPQSTCSLCGNRDAWNTACTSVSCNDNGTCGTGTNCGCKAGFEQDDCGNTACTNSASCQYPNFWCRPTAAGLPNLNCGDVPVGVRGFCNCADGRKPPFNPGTACGTGNSATCEFLCSVGCDPTSSACAGAKPRCLFVADGHDLKAECAAAPAGTPLTEGMPCNKTNDLCGPSLSCSDFGTAHNTPVCARICSANSGCASGLCYRLTTTSPAYGVCSPTSVCTSYQPCGPSAAYSCGAGRFDVTLTPTTECRPVGTKGAGATCASAYECAASLACATTAASSGTPICTPLCDASHPCAAPATCALYGIPSQPPLGYCK